MIENDFCHCSSFHRQVRAERSVVRGLLWWCRRLRPSTSTRLQSSTFFLIFLRPKQIFLIVKNFLRKEFRSVERCLFIELWITIHHPPNFASTRRVLHFFSNRPEKINRLNSFF
ncbi:hypothetical protein F6S87_04990 [Bifidobacterium sp. BRDM6]|uniref:Uncharacterized protein n=1 Tax=Bifidobacterium choloepi TaxID=2614131 RepID=A0A6I5N7Z0_9BIFI|nr:hypothetical protein [Bifidobacterium choloepi]